ncbi:hypothetical protein BDN70DRAFT_762356, partial [Pholiota conissans]
KKIAYKAGWVHPGRKLELTEELVKSLLFLDEKPALQILRQLKEPRDRLQSIGYGELKNRSLVVPLSLTCVEETLSVSVPKVSVQVSSALIDCGASKFGYMHVDFASKHNLPTIPLPHPIGVYNADGSLNCGGSITHVSRLRMTIGDHSEILTFRLTNTGS